MTKDFNKNKKKCQDRESKLIPQKDAFIITFNQNCGIKNPENQDALTGYQRVRHVSLEAQ